MRLDRSWLIGLAACVVAPAAFAADCDPAQEVVDLTPLLVAENERLASDPTDENMAAMMELNQKLADAGSLLVSDVDGACAIYAELREQLETD